MCRDFSHVVGLGSSDKNGPGGTGNIPRPGPRKAGETVGIYILARCSEEDFRGWLDQLATFEEALDSALCENAVADLKYLEANPTRLRIEDLSEDELRIVLNALDN